MVKILVRWTPLMAQLLLSMGALLGGDFSLIPFEHRFIDKANVGADCKAIGDINGDGFADVVVADNETAPLQWYEYPKWTKHVIDSRPFLTTDMQVADIDGDGDIDVVVPDHDASKLLWYRNLGKGQGQWEAVVIGQVDRKWLHDVEVGDVDRDGRLDAVIRGHIGPTTLFLQETPGSWKKVAIDAASEGEGTALGDIDLDGDLDIVQHGYWLEAPANPAEGKSWVRHQVASGWSKACQTSSWLKPKAPVAWVVRSSPQPKRRDMDSSCDRQLGGLRPYLQNG